MNKYKHTSIQRLVTIYVKLKEAHSELDYFNMSLRTEIFKEMKIIEKEAKDRNITLE